jgi:TrmH family RNA methyltransferase
MERTETLTSPANPLLKDLRRAVARGGLTDDGFMVAESFHLVAEALRSKLRVAAIVVAESALDRAPRPDGVRLVVVESAAFAKLADTESSQGVIALVEPPVWRLEQTLAGQTLAVVLDGLQDPGNAGAVVRAAEAFGATGVVFPKGTVSPFNPKTLRASAGSLFRVPFVHGVDAAAARDEMERRGCAIFPAMARGAVAASDVDLRRACALVIGSEARGVSDVWSRGALGISIATERVESLNAAVAAGILLYEARSQRSRP